jgi:hypothetical protein
MSEVIFLHEGKVLPRARPDGTRKRAQTGRQIFVREAHSGLWTVHDDRDRNLGWFRDRSSAFRFVADEFGAAARLVVQPRFSTPALRAIAHLQDFYATPQIADLSR